MGGKKLENYYVGGNKTCDLEAISESEAETGKHMLLKGKTISKYCRNDQVFLYYSTPYPGALNIFYF